MRFVNSRSKLQIAYDELSCKKHLIKIISKLTLDTEYLIIKKANRTKNIKKTHLCTFIIQQMTYSQILFLGRFDSTFNPFQLYWSSTSLKRFQKLPKCASGAVELVISYNNCIVLSSRTVK